MQQNGGSNSTPLLRTLGDPQFNHQYLYKREGLSPRLCYSRDQITGFLLVPAQLKLT